MFAQHVPASARFHAQHFHACISQKCVEQPDGVRAAADAGHQQIRQAAFAFQNLRRASSPITFENRAPSGIGMRAQHRAEQIMRGAHVGHPVAHGFVDGILQRAAAGIDAHHFRAQQAHARNVQPLPLHVFRAHVDHALQAKARRHGRRGHAVLPGAGLRDDAPLAHAHRQQRLAEAVIDLVRAGVQQVFALDVNARAAEIFGEARGKLQRRGPPREISQQSSSSRANRRPRAPRRRRARVPRAAPPAFRERSARRKRRIGRERPARFAPPWFMIFSFSLWTWTPHPRRGWRPLLRASARAWRGDPFSRDAIPRRWPHPPRTAALRQSPARRSPAATAGQNHAAIALGFARKPPIRRLSRAAMEAAAKPSSRNAEAALYFARVRSRNCGPAANALITPNRSLVRRPRPAAHRREAARHRGAAPRPAPPPPPWASRRRRPPWPPTAAACA